VFAPSTGEEDGLPFISRAQLEGSVGHGLIPAVGAAPLSDRALCLALVGLFQLPLLIVVVPGIELDYVFDVVVFQDVYVDFMLANDAR